MLWINKHRSTAVAAFVTLALTGTAIAAPLVVRSAGPSAKAYPAGKAIPDNASITLKAGDSVVLLDGRGTRTLTGPGTFSATASATAAATTGTTLSQLASSGGERRARIGAVRSASGVDKNAGRNPSVWYVDLDRSANMCVADTSAVVVWRKDSTAAASVAVTGATGSGKIDFAAGQASSAWPASLPVKSGDAYKLSWAGAKAPTAIKFVVVKAASPGLEDMAQSLIQGGCNAQLDLLIQTVALPGENPKG